MLRRLPGKDSGDEKKAGCNARMANTTQAPLGRHSSVRSHACCSGYQPRNQRQLAGGASLCFLREQFHACVERKALRRFRALSESSSKVR